MTVGGRVHLDYERWEKYMHAKAIHSNETASSLTLMHMKAV
jgi:hypothetical protein